MNQFLKTHNESADVIVVGGGSAGVIAAIQASREGAKTILIEMTGKLGGTITTGLVSAPAYFYSRTKQIIKGIGWELILKNKELDNIPLPDFLTPNPIRPSYHVPVNPHLYALIAENTCLKSGVTIHYHEIAVDIDDDGKDWILTTVGKNVKRTIKAREIIDCTGDADIVGMLGLERLKGEIRQPGTLIFKIAGYDIEKLDKELVEKEYQKALTEERIQKGDYCFKDKPFIGFLANGGHNQQHIINADSSSSADQTDADIKAHQSLLRLFMFIKQLPGCEKATIDFMADSAAIRETWRIVGEKTVTYEDYMSGKIFDDAVAYSLYFIDIHHKDGIHHEFLPYELTPTIPLGALIPKGSNRIIVAGRCVSSDQRAFSALRVESSCMAMGQAAGVAAALAVRLGVPSRDVPHAKIRTTLKKHDAIVPWIDDLTGRGLIPHFNKSFKKHHDIFEDPILAVK
jgi:hypothetical protein